MVSSILGQTNMPTQVKIVTCLGFYKFSLIISSFLYGSSVMGTWWKKRFETTVAKRNHKSKETPTSTPVVIWHLINASSTFMYEVIIFIVFKLKAFELYK